MGGASGLSVIGLDLLCVCGGGGGGSADSGFSGLAEVSTRINGLREK